MGCHSFSFSHVDCPVSDVTVGDQYSRAPELRPGPSVHSVVTLSSNVDSMEAGTCLSYVACHNNS